MNICFVSDSYPTEPRFGGIAIYTQTAAKALVARGHTVHVLIGRHAQESDSSDGPISIHVRRVRWIPVLGKWLDGLGESVGLARAIARLHRQYKFDLIEIPNWEGYGLVPALRQTVPVVVRLHTSMIETVATQNRNPKPNERFMIWSEKTSARLARAVVTHSQSHAAKLVKAYRLHSVSVIPHGIDLPQQMATPTSSNLSVLCVGAMTARKGAATLLEAIPRVLQDVPTAEFWLVGNDPDHRAEKQLFAAHPEISSERVKFLGSVSKSQLDQAYSSCAVYASASIYESFGLTFVEAMAHGKPVVGCAVSAMTEIIQHNQNGLLVPPNDPASFAKAIVTLLINIKLRQQLGQTAETAARTLYSADRMARDIESFFQSLIPQHPRRSE